MSYGTIKIDTITFTDGGVDKSVSVSGLVQNPEFSGTISGVLVEGQTVSGGTVTGDTGQFDTLTGNTAAFTTVTGVTFTGTTVNAVTVSGGTVTGNTGQFTNLSVVSGVFTSGVFSSGSVANPSITFTGDLDTGFANTAANQLSIVASGEKAYVNANSIVLNPTSGNVDIEIKGSARSNLLYVDASANCIGINQSSPEVELDVYSGAIRSAYRGIGGRTNSASNANWIYFGDWIIANNAQSQRISFDILGSQGYGEREIGKTHAIGGIVNTNTLDLMTWSETDIANGHRIAWLYDTDRFKFYADATGGQFFSSVAANVNITLGTWISRNTDTGSTTAPVGSTIAPFKFNVRLGNRNLITAISGSVAINDLSGDIDFVARGSGETNLLYVDASAKTVGIKTANPTSALTVRDGALAAGTIQIGADYDAKTLTDNTDKLGTITVPSYTTSTDLIRVVSAYSSASLNLIQIGGGTNSQKTATSTRIYAGSGILASGGKELARFDYNEVVINEDSNNHTDFRVETDSRTHAFFVDASSNKVGFSTSNPTYSVDFDDITVGIFKAGNNTGGGTLRIGGSKTNESVQYSTISAQQFHGTNEPEGYLLIGGTATSGVNYINIGGGVDEMNTATVVRMYAGSSISGRSSGNNGQFLYADSSTVVFNENSEDKDFRIESDGNDHQFFVDGGNNAVAINYSSIASTASLTSRSNGNSSPLLLRATNSQRYFNKTIFNGQNPSANFAELLTIDSWQGGNSRMTIDVRIRGTNPVANHALIARAGAFANQGGTRNAQTFVDEYNYGSYASGSLIWSGNILYFHTPAVAYLYYSVDVAYVTYDGANVTMNPAYQGF